eukprot:1138941-Pelagomonas_calceolata.AAC.1
MGPHFKVTQPLSHLLRAALADVIKKYEQMCMHTDAPGMTPEDIKVEITAGNLVVSGEKTQQVCAALLRAQEA